MTALLHAFFSDDRIKAAILLIALDLLLGVIAAVQAGTFRLAYVSDFLRHDGLKLLAFFLLYGGLLYAGGSDLVIPGLNVDVVVNGAYGLLVLGWVGSILNSLHDIGLLKNLPDWLAGKEPAAPGRP